MGVEGVRGAASKASEAASNSPGQAELQRRATNMTMKPVIDRAVRNINANAQKFRDAIKGEGG